MKIRFVTLTLIVFTTLSLANSVHASDLVIPNTFTAGTTASAQQVNDNFTATQTAVNTKQNKITGLCPAGLFVKQINSDGSLVCDSTPAGTGDISAVNAGVGLLGGGTSGDVSLTVDTSVIQQRLGAGCAAGSSIRDISVTGMPTCEIDDDTTYTAGTGINISGNTINLSSNPVVNSLTYSTPKVKRQLLAMNDFGCRDPSLAGCPGSNDNGRWKATSAGTLIMSGRLTMPQSAVLSDVWCVFHDESTNNASFRILYRPINLAGPGWNVMTNTIFTAGSSTSVQTLQASSNTASNWTTSGLTADNSTKAFFVEVTLPYDASAILALQGCYYDYTVTSP